MIPAIQELRYFAGVCLGLCMLSLSAPVHAEALKVPPEVRRGLNMIFNGDPDAAIPLAKKLEAERPDHPVGYLLELEALWWKTYCTACEVKWGMADAWRKPHEETDQRFLALSDEAINLANAQLANHESAEMHLYAGMGFAFKTRLRALRDEHRAVARNGVAARGEFVRALELDPEMYDADAGLGIYNYYADALSGFVKVLRFFMGIPGGSRKDAIPELELAMEKGELMKVEARFYLARNLRTYDQQYERAQEVLTPLVEEYPRNPLFHLLSANLDLELGHREKAAAALTAAEDTKSADSQCSAKMHEIARAFLDSLNPASQTHPATQATASTPIRP